MREQRVYQTRVSGAPCTLTTCFLKSRCPVSHCRLWVCSQSWTEKCEVGGTVRAFALDLSAVISGNYKVSH